MSQLSFLFMNIDREIYNVLSMAGRKGLPAKKLALHVYNACNGFFSQIDFNDIYKYVRNFIRRNSKGLHSLVERAGKRGYYRLRKDSMQTLTDLFSFDEQ